jgi:prepilin-type N-terminal cleavage/methylation domain-containing protein
MIRLFSSSARRRAGFTLTEIIVCVVILGILGTALTRLMLAQSRLYALQRAKRDARAIGRTSMNLLFSDLRMVHDGADAPGSVMLASPNSLSVKVPYAVGLVCGNASPNTVVSMFPLDSAARAMSKYAGYAWRNRATKQYTYVPVVDTVGNAPVTPSGSASVCTSTAKIKSDTVSGRAWGPVDVKPQSVPAGTQPGAPVFFFQNVLYFFGNSTSNPGRVGLFRRIEGRTAEELTAPFDASARFKFFVRNVDTSTVTPPAVLDSLVGVSMVLTGSSSATMAGRAAEKSRMETAVLFRNHPGF